MASGGCYSRGVTPNRAKLRWGICGCWLKLAAVRSFQPGLGELSHEQGWIARGRGLPVWLGGFFGLEYAAVNCGQRKRASYLRKGYRLLKIAIQFHGPSSAWPASMDGDDGPVLIHQPVDL